jgi:hypothetical protein
VSEDERTGPASEASAKRQTAMPTSLMKQVVRIFAVVWLVLNEREVRVLWKSVAWTKRVKWRLLFEDCTSRLREATAVLTLYLQPQRSRRNCLLTTNKTCHRETPQQSLYTRYATHSAMFNDPTKRSIERRPTKRDHRMILGRGKVLPPRGVTPLR